MTKGIKAIQCKVTIHHEAVVDVNEPWNDSPAYDTQEMRYCIVSTETGEVLDDAQGYGYKTAQKAYAAYSYKMRDKSKGQKKSAKKKQIEEWMKEHNDFVEAMDEVAFEIAKGTRSPNDKFDSKFVKEMLRSFDLSPDFSASELLRVWRKR